MSPPSSGKARLLIYLKQTTIGFVENVKLRAAELIVIEYASPLLGIERVMEGGSVSLGNFNAGAAADHDHPEKHDACDQE